MKSSSIAAISLALPRTRDRGVSRKAFDGKGNYTLGPCKEQIIFPEINYDRIDVIKGLNISFGDDLAKTG